MEGSRDQTLKFRLSQDEYNLIKAAAMNNNTTISKFIRDTLVDQIQKGNGYTLFSNINYVSTYQNLLWIRNAVNNSNIRRDIRTEINERIIQVWDALN